MEQKTRTILITSGLLLLVVGGFLIFQKNRGFVSPIPEAPTVRVIFTSPPVLATPTPFIETTPTSTPRLSPTVKPTAVSTKNPTPTTAVTTTPKVTVTPTGGVTPTP